MTKSLLAILLFIAPAALLSQPVISFDTVVSGLSEPLYVTEVNDNSHRLFIVERTGKIRIWNGSSLLPTAFLDISSLTTAANSGERGLLSLAFHPNYSTNGFFYIYYTNLAGDITVARYSRSTNDLANAASGVVLMNIPKRFANHNGGNLLFGQDGYLYFGTGDGGSGDDPDNNAQNGASLLGKMLRIDVNNPNPPYYSIPATNPFFGSTTVKPEIIATGLRNPWRWSFDKQTGDMWIADVGQDHWEEVNVVPAAKRLNKNYNWSCYEGTHVNANKPQCGTRVIDTIVSPVFEYGRDNATGGQSITGGYVYRGTEYPSLQGYYLFTDYLTGNGWLTRSNGNGGWTTTMQKWTKYISSFGEAADGTLYATTLSGTLFKVVAATALPVKLVSFSGSTSGNNFAINWKVQNEESGDIYVLEKRTDPGKPFTEVTKMKAPAVNRASGSYDLKLPLPFEKTYYRLTIIGANRQIQYSNIINVNARNGHVFKAFVSGTNMQLEHSPGTTYIEMYDAAGKTTFRQKIDPAATHTTIPLKAAAKGIVTVRALIDNEWQSVRVVY